MNLPNYSGNPRSFPGMIYDSVSKPSSFSLRCWCGLPSLTLELVLRVNCVVKTMCPLSIMTRGRTPVGFALSLPSLSKPGRVSTECQRTKRRPGISLTLFLPHQIMFSGSARCLVKMTTQQVLKAHVHSLPLNGFIGAIGNTPLVSPAFPRRSRWEYST